MHVLSTFIDGKDRLYLLGRCPTMIGKDDAVSCELLIDCCMKQMGVMRQKKVGREMDLSGVTICLGVNPGRTEKMID